MANLGGWEMIILLGVLVLVFGAKKLPEMARSVGQSARVLKGEMKGLKHDETPSAAAAEPPAVGATGSTAASPAPAVPDR